MALQPLIPDPNQPQGGLPTLDSMPMPNPVPSLPPTLKPLVTTPRIQQEQSLQDKISSYENPAAPQGGFWHQLGHIAARVGNIAGDIVAPQTMALIPGTDLNRGITHAGQVKELAGLQGQDRQDATDAGENTLRSAQTANVGENAAKTQQEIDAPPSEPSLAQAYAHAVMTAQKAGKDPSQDPVVQHIADAITSLQKQPAQKPGTKTVQLEIGGKPHQVLIDEATGKTIQDLGESGEKPPVVNVHSGDAHEFAETERGRGLLDKAEASYRTAHQGAETMRDMVASAQAGNKMSAQVLPLEGALAITTAQGVHRINRTEVDQYAGAGNLYDKIAGEAGKLTAGQPIPPNILADIQKLTDIQERGAFETYRGAHDSAIKRYNLKGEDLLPEPGGGGGTYKQTATGANGHKIGSNDGGKTWVDTQTGKAI